MLSGVAVACLRSSWCSPIASILRRGSCNSCRGSSPLSSRSLAREQQQKKGAASGSKSRLTAAANTMSSASAAAALDPSSSSDPPMAPFRVAVVGGGLAGAAAASTIAADANSRVTLFDAGFRGVGGRASSRPLLRGSEAAVEGGINPTTDHGCQFVVDDGSDARLSALLRQHATEWRDEALGESGGGGGGCGGSRFVSLDFETGRVRAKGEEQEQEEGGAEEDHAGGGGGGDDFFGVLTKGSAVWVGSPTIDAIPKRLVDGSGGGSPANNIDVRVGWKVTAVAREGFGGGAGAVPPDATGGGGVQRDAGSDVGHHVQPLPCPVVRARAAGGQRCGAGSPDAVSVSGREGGCVRG